MVPEGVYYPIILVMLATVVIGQISVLAKAFQVFIALQHARSILKLLIPQVCKYFNFVEIIRLPSKM